MDSADHICMSRAFSVTVYLQCGQLPDSTSAAQTHLLSAPSRRADAADLASVMPLPVLLPLRLEGVTASTQIFTQTPLSSPVFHLSAADSKYTHTLMPCLAVCEPYSEAG